MTSRFFKAVLVAGSIVLAGGAYAQQSKQTTPPTFEELASSIKVQTGGRLLKAENGVPQIVLGTTGTTKIAAQPKQMTPAVVAQRTKDYFFTTASTLGFLPSSAELTATEATKVGEAFNTVITLSYNGIPVRDRKANVAIGAITGELVTMRNSLPSIEPNLSEPIATESSVLADAKSRSAVTATVTGEPKLVYIASHSNTSLRLAYEVQIEEQSPSHLWRYTYDAETGALLEKRDRIVYCMDPSHDHAEAEPVQSPAAPAATVGGKVSANVLYHSPFDPDTTVSLPHVKVIVNGKTTYADENGNFSVDGVDYPLTISSNLESRYFNVRRQDATSGKLTLTLPSGTPDLDWGPSVGIIAERSAYNSVHRVHKYVKSFDPSFTLMDKKIQVNINVEGSCNAFYQPGQNSLNFFPQAGDCSNTAEIADVVYHEYGHHYHHMRYEERGAAVVSRALGEAFADILSNFLRDDPIIGDGFTGSNSILRNSKNTRKWPGSVSSDPHTTGTILTGAVWDLRLAIGLGHSEYLFHEALKAVPDASSNSEDEEAALEAFTDVLLAYLLADDDDNNLQNGTPHGAQIAKAFDDHGIGLANLLEVGLNQIADQTADAELYPVSMTAKYNGVLGEVANDSVKVFYSVNGGPFASVSLQHVGGDNYEGFIPKLPAGSIVKYYSTARTTLEGTSPVRIPRNNATYTFLVGYVQQWLDDAENEKGMVYGNASDEAANGVWVRDIPNGTIWIDQLFQLDHDHSTNGNFAYITGNQNENGVQAPADALYNFDMQVRTTLETPAIDVSSLKSPVLKFWYYHQSEQVFSATKNSFRVSVSTTGGSSWKTIYTSNEVYPDWTSTIVSLGFEPTGSSSIKLRFIASAAPGTIVEAGLDDIAILSPQPTGTGSVADDEAKQIELSVYPNPVMQNGKLNFSYSLPNTTIVQAELKNVMGSAVWSMNGELKTMGSYSESIPLDLPSGTYWLQLTTSLGTFYKQVHVVK